MADYRELAAIRLGFGLSPRMASPESPTALVASIRAGIAPDDVRMADVMAMQRHYVAMNRHERNGPDAVAALKAGNAVMRTAMQRRLARAAGDVGGFGERLVQFWSDHFTVTVGSVFQSLMAAAFVDEAIRPHVTGRFADLMFAAETHARMLTYLDQNRSFGPNSPAAVRHRDRNLGLNENLAREMIELHSLGVGADYGQRDVQELARLLTGLTYDRDGALSFRPNMAEPGVETVLGRSYGGTRRGGLEAIRAMMTDLARHPATARHIARKLVVHFVSDDPPQSMVDRLTRIWMDTEGDLSAINRAVADAPELQTRFRQKLRQPFDFMVAALRGLGLDQGHVMALADAEAQARLVRGLAAMGQPYAKPRGPDGWPEDAEAWATPQGLAARLEWALRQPSKLIKPLPDPRSFLAGALGGTASPALEWAVSRAESAAEGIAVVLASADFNRR